MCGRGPTIDISPFSTLINWGSSSRLVFLRNFPIVVILESFSSVVFVADSSLTIIVLNFRQENTSSWKPYLFCTKKTGPLEVALMRIAIMGNNHEHSNTNIDIENRMSKVLFT